MCELHKNEEELSEAERTLRNDLRGAEDKLFHVDALGHPMSQEQSGKQLLPFIS